MSSNLNVKRPGNISLFSIVMIGLAVILIIFFIYTTYKGFTSYTQTSPYLINGIADGSSPQQISSYQIPPPTDSDYGIEYSYSFWIFIKDTNFTTTQQACKKEGSSNPFLHIFHKGSNDFIAAGSSGCDEDTYYPLLQNPGVWLYPNTNKLNIRFNTYENVVETSDIGNIPLNMWVNVIIILIGSSVDVYVNGNLKKRTKLSGVPKINYGNLYSSNWGGFQGYLSNLRYFNYAIQPFLVDQIFNSGPSTTYSQATTKAYTVTDASATLSQNYWMTTGYPNIQGGPGYKKPA
jgi:hypothetical protein